MAKSGAFSFTNTTVSTYKALPLYDMAEKTNYASNTDGSTSTDYRNTRAAAADASEVLHFFSNKVKVVPTRLEVYNPSKKRMSARTGASSPKLVAPEGVNYGVVVDAIFTITDSSDANYRVDLPIRCAVSFSHEINATLSVNDLKTLLGRTVSTLFEADGDSRIADLQGGIVDIVSN